MVTQAFALPKDKAGHGPSSDHTTEIVFQVADIIPAPPASLTETDELTNQLKDELANQTLSEYTEALKTRYGTSVNQTEVDAAVGVSQE
jgi:peptidyl-prolyl cis-trans isomerase D